MNEIITNSLKHAFGETEHPEIRVAAHRAGQTVTLTCCDNGCGIPETINPETSESFGLRLLGLLAQQISASLELSREGGTCYTAVFEEGSIGARSGRPSFP